MILLQESVKLIMNSMEEREKDKKSFNGILFTTHVDEKHVLAQTTLFQEKSYRNHETQKWSQSYK